MIIVRTSASLQAASHRPPCPPAIPGCGLATTMAPRRGSATLGSSGRGVQPLQGHAVAPDGGPALDDHKRAAGDDGQRGQGLGGGDRRGDGEGVDDGREGLHNLLNDTSQQRS